MNCEISRKIKQNVSGKASFILVEIQKQLLKHSHHLWKLKITSVLHKSKCWDTKICQNVSVKIFVFKGQLSKDADGSVHILIYTS